MKLENILLFTSEETIVNVVDCKSNEIISRYDGKDSIDSELNDREAIKQYVQSNELFIVIL